MSDALEDDAADAGLPVPPPDAALSRETVVQTYRRYAPVYDRLFGAVLEQGRRELARSVASLGARRVLEVGVGTGLTLRHYPAEAEVVGIDVSRAMLDKAERRRRELPARRIELLEMDAERMRFADASFDCVTLPYVLSVTPDPARLVAEIRRVCRPDGHLVLLNHFSGDPRWRWLERPIRRLADRIGFRSDFDYDVHVLAHDWKVQSVRPVNLLGLSRLVVLRNR